MSKNLTELEKQKIQYQLVFDHSPILIAHVDKEYHYRIVNKEYCLWMGKTREQIIGMHLKDVLTETSFNNAKPNMDRALKGEKINFEAKVPHSSGTYRWVNATYVPDKDSDGNVTGFCAFIIDINEQKHREFEQESLFNAIENGIEGFSLHDKDGNYIFVNSSEAQMYGYDKDELIGKSWKILYGKEQAKIIEEEYFPSLLNVGHWQGELRGLKKSGDFFDVEVSLTLIKNEAGEANGLFCACRDISERKRSQEEVDFLAYHDSLTGLPNRLLFKERLEQMLIRAKRRNTIVAVLFIDLDYFKYVNDTLGHSIGDRLLQAVAGRIQSVLRTEDTVARLSGDEFTVLLSELIEPGDVERIIKKLLDAFKAPVILDAREIHQSISIGVSLYPKDGEDVETLMKNADAAMYKVKEEGRQNFLFYTPGLTDSAIESLLYRAQLQSALEKEEFVLHYQPLISLEENRIIGFESLIRWQHPEKGLVYPDKFIRYAEESGLIVNIGYWVIETVCKQMQEWQEIGISIEHIAVNVSGVQLQVDFVDNVLEILSETGTDANKLEFEITETFLMKGLKQPVEKLQELRNHGIIVAIDDFGVGYSSLSQLRQLPSHGLKIDRSFVNDIVEDVDDRAIVKAIVGLGKSLNLQITAEGVETLEQHALLNNMGCKKAQGYFYARPCPVSEVPEMYKILNTQLQDI